jgi:hypothetical protein
MRRDLLSGLIELLEAGDREGVVTTFMTDIVKMPATELDLIRGTASWQGRIAAAHTIPREMRIAMTINQTSHASPPCGSRRCCS